MRSIIIVFICSVLCILPGCNSSETPISSNEVTQKLLTSKKWSSGSATIDGVSTDLFTSLTLSFDTNNPIFTYTATNGGAVWPASGTWSFVGEDGKRIKRNDGLDVIIESIDEKQLVISYTWFSTTYGGGRTTGVKGLNRIFLN